MVDCGTIDLGENTSRPRLQRVADVAERPDALMMSQALGVAQVLGAAFEGKLEPLLVGRPVLLDHHDALRVNIHAVEPVSPSSPVTGERMADLLGRTVAVVGDDAS